MNYKKIALGSLCVAVAFIAMDFLIHGVLLMDQYKETSHLWRPMEEMNMPLNMSVTLIFSILYVLFYANMVIPKNVTQGAKFGLWYGLIAGFSMGFGTYTYMPISMALASSWFLALLLESVVAGAIMGLIVKD